jgi:hypothetical protein
VTDDLELRRLIAALDEATAAKAKAWDRIQRDPHDDALWEEYDIWRQEEDVRHQAIREYRASIARG